MRGVASLGVVLFHAYSAAFGDEAGFAFFDKGPAAFFEEAPAAQAVLHPFVGFGYLGVALFFVISGFCIHLPFAGGRKPMEPWPFAKRRFLRLYPVFLLVTVANFAWVLLGSTVSGQENRALTGQNFLGHLLLWFYWVPDGVSTLGINAAFWSIAIEAHFYVLFALFFSPLMRLGVGKCAGVLFAGGVAYYLWWYVSGARETQPAFMEPRYFSLARFGEWLIGAWLAELYVRGHLRRFGKSLVAVLASCAGGLTLIAGAMLIARRSSSSATSRPSPSPRSASR